MANNGTIWLGIVGRIEHCRACQQSFALLYGESVSSLVHRYSRWREEHAHPDPEPEADGRTEGATA